MYKLPLLTSGVTKGNPLLNALCFTLALIALLLSSSAYAETYLIRIIKGTTPVEGVTVVGNFGVNSLPGRFTDTEGEWTLDTAGLPSSNPTLGFVHPSQALRFDPPEITVSHESCPGRVCLISAIEGSYTTSIINWSILNSNGKGVAGIPVTVPYSETPCEKLSDHEGYVFFTVKRSAQSCNDTDFDNGNNFSAVLPIELPGKRCDYTTLLQRKFRV